MYKIFGLGGAPTNKQFYLTNLEAVYQKYIASGECPLNALFLAGNDVLSSVGESPDAIAAMEEFAAIHAESAKNTPCVEGGSGSGGALQKQPSGPASLPVRSLTMNPVSSFSRKAALPASYVSKPPLPVDSREKFDVQSAVKEAQGEDSFWDSYGGILLSMMAIGYIIYVAKKNGVLP